jgi:acrylyl-CoA reductase (NADPH)
MAETFRAIRIDKDGESQRVGVVDLTDADLMDGDVTVAVHHSTVNFKDGLALTGAAPVVRHWPMVPGIDLAGEVLESRHPEIKPGQKVVLNGWGLGETHWGGYAGKARVMGDWLIPLPEAFTTEEAMAIGTAGYTAMLSVLALERHGLSSQHGPVLVTGAAGGVGSVAVAVLAKLGYHVIASTGRTQESGYLKELGAAEIIPREELAGKARPLGKERWAGVVDSVGSTTLANALASTKYGGAVAACGLAGGMDLPGSVAPFILRGVALLGIESVYAPKKLRLEAWSRLARDLDPRKLKSMMRTVPLGDVPAIGEQILKGQIRGRVVVDVRA